MKKFTLVNALTLDEAVSSLRKYNEEAKILAGGIELLGGMKKEIHSIYPKVVVNINTVPNMDYIKEEKGILRIGALTKLSSITENKNIANRYNALAEAALMVGSPHLRRMITIGGNICQEVRCWYFRSSNNYFNCSRKGGKTCYALIGDERYHSIFGGISLNNTACTTDCPAHVAIPLYLNKVRDGDIDEAAKMLLSSNPFPAITGRVCPHFCENDCSRNCLDESVSIRGVERYIGDYVLDNASAIIKPPEINNSKNVAIVGSGPAGLSAAYYLRMSGHHVTVFDRMEEAGGMLSYLIPSYRLPKGVVRRTIKLLKNMGIEFKMKTDVGKGITINTLKKSFDSVFLACGGWKQRSIGLEGEQLTKSGLEFLSNVKQGMKEMPGKKVIVIGGGNVAVDAAITAVRLGAKEVMITCLESRQEMPALEWEIEQAVEEGVKLMPSWGPYKVIQSKGKVVGIDLARCTSIFDSEGRFAPILNNSVKERVETDQIIMAVGLTTDLSYINPKRTLTIDRGLIVVDKENQKTNIPGIFAGGEVTSGTATVIESMAAGKRAADAICRYLKGKEALIEAQEKKTVKFLSKINDKYLEEKSQVKMAKLSISERSIDLEDAAGLHLNEVETEAQRCFDCACVAVNAGDIAPALIVLDATVVTTKRKIAAEDFWDVTIPGSTILDVDEIITEIQVPEFSGKSAFNKFATRASIDYPIVNCAAAIRSGSARICLNGVFNNPYRAIKAEEAIKGKTINETNAEAAGSAAVSNTISIKSNKYKIQIAKIMVKRALLSCA